MLEYRGARILGKRVGRSIAGLGKFISRLAKAGLNPFVKAARGGIGLVFRDKPPASGAELAPAVLQTSKGSGDYIKREFESTKEATKVAGLTPQ